MNFLEAVKAMKEGKKVKRKIWARPIRLGEILFSLQEVEATDWEIVEDKKTLSDKFEEGRLNDNDFNEFYYTQQDVKEALKEFIDWCNNHMFGANTATNKAKEIFGDRLL